ncbi:hemerythrin domain-containing protein [Bizionia gelidisalsuginis]|uniref:Hemerythrin domain-containing protein n=1 Tax=Bizionia gelidisalsuginis TaxID=291188 RepID=A0ABY3M8T2_9FLAO|nr:hemerythrin domain-containing protein [Bizionia gelidisalsuginis]TYC10664.1 hemerythrin domain-containing protein [Bizionia gelidisalsuginis]
MAQKPLKRHDALKPLSREHHYGLLLSWKIRTGFSKNISAERIKIYADWFYKTQLIPHFELEEAEIFTILNPDHEGIKKVLEDHKRLHYLFTEEPDIETALIAIERELEQHIRFEERVLFPEIQKVATETQMIRIEKIHQPEAFQDKLDDEFWR